MSAKSFSVTMRVRIGDSELEITGPSDFVEKKIDEFVKKHKESLARQTRVSLGPVSEEAGPVQATQKRLSIGQFFKKAAPRTDVERALLAGYFLEKFEGSEAFTAAEVREKIRHAKVRPPGNPNDAVAKNVMKGLMMSAGNKGGRMAFVLTTDGEESVANALQQE